MSDLPLGTHLMLDKIIVEPRFEKVAYVGLTRMQLCQVEKALAHYGNADLVEPVREIVRRAVLSIDQAPKYDVGIDLGKSPVHALMVELAQEPDDTPEPVLPAQPKQVVEATTTVIHPVEVPEPERPPEPVKQTPARPVDEDLDLGYVSDKDRLEELRKTAGVVSSNRSDDEAPWVLACTPIEVRRVVEFAIRGTSIEEMLKLPNVPSLDTIRAICRAYSKIIQAAKDRSANERPAYLQYQFEKWKRRYALTKAQREAVSA